MGRAGRASPHDTRTASRPAALADRDGRHSARVRRADTLGGPLRRAKRRPPDRTESGGRSMSASILSATARTARLVAVLASLAAGAIYLFIGTGVVSVGRSTQDATTDLFAFGVLMGVVSLAIAV